MKPIALITCRGRRHDSFDRVRGKFRRQPFTDYSYHSGAFEQSSADYLPTYVRPFWNIAGDYLKREARHDFWSETALFTFITVTAALPLINNAHALIEFVRAITPQ
jgi:hypothetical protein